MALSADASPSRSQLQVSQALRDGLGLRVEDEYRCPRSGYSIDMLVSDAPPSAASAGAPGGGRCWAVEFDGPGHFLACGSPTGATLLKHRLLQQMGYALVVVPYWEWDQVSGDESLQAEYLRGKLDASCVGAPAAASCCRMEQADEPSAAGAARMDQKLEEEERTAGE